MGMIFSNELEYSREHIKDNSPIWYYSPAGPKRRLLDVMGKFSALLWVLFLLILTAVIKFPGN